ncbi:tyrosine-type recombinase/integrase [Candidatus Parcubacteria bacterium]|nr:tyrosine-type recombinase/integrase [Candidatus Parcubacteria bacterium]
MYTSFKGNTTVIGREPFYKLEQEMRLRNFSPKTVKAYLYYNKELLRFANYKSPLKIVVQDIRDYLDFLISSGKSRSTLDLAINAIKFYYSSILERKFFDKNKIVRPKREKYLPIVLSKEQIIKMISGTGNIKHCLMLVLLYSSGLRVSELVDLRISDIDVARKTVHVRNGKGKKDRITVLSEKAIWIFERYFREYQPLEYIFESYHLGTRISTRTVQVVVAKAAREADIKKTVGPHTLRHSFATHMLENGVNLRYIQSMLGHKRLETTQIYTKVAVNRFKEIGDLL